MDQLDPYRLEDALELLTPCLVVYPEIVAGNLREALRIAGSASSLRPHVKTHKTPQIVHMALEMGISRHKCATLGEAQMLADCGVPDVLIAYPQVGPSIRLLSELIDAYPETQFSTVADDGAALRQLSQSLAEAHQSLRVLLDVDTGMHRTGVPVGDQAVELYGLLSSLPGLLPGGLHLYDGQNHQPNPEERRSAVTELMRHVDGLVDRLQQRGFSVPKLVCGGTPTFPMFAEWAARQLEPPIECSPGTCALSDFNYGSDFRDMSGFRPAALLLARVISRVHPHRLTIDLGYKAVASDPPAGKRCHILGLPDAREIQQSEEHLIIETSLAESFAVGDLLYVVPAHICPTVALHRQMQVVRAGRVAESWEVAARDRLYRPRLPESADGIRLG